MKICIATVPGGFSVYQEDESAEQGAAAGQPGMPLQAAPEQPESAEQSGGQTVATVEEALQLAGSMLQGDAGNPASDDNSAESLFQSGYKSASKKPL